MKKKYKMENMSSSVTLDSLGTLKQKSDEFSGRNKFGCESTKCAELEKRGFTEEELLANANSAYPIIHHRVYDLMIKFLDLKKRVGSEVEKEIYKDISIESFIDRLVGKRPLVFVGERDTYVLRDKGKGEWVEGKMGADVWHSVGTDKETEPLVMADYLTYDECKLAALLGASTFTVTANKGDRKNSGVWAGVEEDWERRGVIVGLVGPRMHKVGAMESQEMRVMEEQNNSKSVAKDSVLQLFANFYGMERVATYKEVRTAFDHKEVGVFAALKRTFQRGGLQVQTEDFLPVLTTRPITEESYLHLPAYTQRIRMVADMLLAEANDRARREGKAAFVHVVGLGLGVWQISPKQKPIFAGIFLDALVDLKPDHVSDLALSWVFEPALVGGKWELPKEFDWGNRRVVDGSKVKFTSVPVFNFNLRCFRSATERQRSTFVGGSLGRRCLRGNWWSHLLPGQLSFHFGFCNCRLLGKNTNTNTNLTGILC